LSFDSISAVAEHAADIHYSTTDDSNIPLRKDSVYLLDAGAHYEGINYIRY
jgi:Xaa-Pro aminopeptidase